MFFPIFINKKEESKAEEKLYTATEVEELIIEAVSLVDNSELVRLAGLRVIPQRSHCDSSIDIFVKDYNKQTKSNIKIQRIRGEK